MRALAVLGAAAALGLPAAPAAAHEYVVTHDPAVARVFRPFDAPAPGTGRVRMVYHGDTAAMLTVDQFWHYQRAYDAAMARFAMHQPIHRAHASARHAAWHAVVRGPTEGSGPIAIFPVSR